MSQTDAEILRQEFELGFTYTRSTGPVVGRFYTELKNRKIVGIKGSDGKVIVPPAEFDPKTAEGLTDFVEVGQTGVVKTWCWVTQPREKQPLQKPFAWALIQLDGADTSMLHAVDAGSEAAMSTGMKVRARWAQEPKGQLRDLVCFEPV